MGLENGRSARDIPVMHTLTVDAEKRVVIADAKPGQVFTYENEQGTITLTPVPKVPAKPRFPRGSLLKYFTPERDKEELEIQSGCSLEVPE